MNIFLRICIFAWYGSFLLGLLGQVLLKKKNNWNLIFARKQGKKKNMERGGGGHKKKSLSTTNVQVKIITMFFAYLVLATTV